MRQGGFYGDRRHGGENLEVGDFDVPIAWAPKYVNNSSGLITYAGGRSYMLKQLNVNPSGVEIRFTDPLDPASASDPANYDVERWEYMYSSRYGSSEMSLENPGRGVL